MADGQASFGAMRHRITIQQQVETKTSEGSYVPTYEDLWTRVAACVESLSGVILQRAMQIDPRIRYSVQMRWLDGLKAGQRVIWHRFDGDQTLEMVEMPRVHEKARMVELMCAQAQD